METADGPHSAWITDFPGRFCETHTLKKLNEIQQMEDKMGAYAMHIKQEYNCRITILKLIVNLQRKWWVGTVYQ